MPGDLSPVGTEPIKSGLKCVTPILHLISTIFLRRTDILCRYDLNLVGILRLLVDIFFYRRVCIMFRGGIC